MTPAVFLDRDGTLIEEVGYLDAVDRMVVFPWSIDAIRVLNDAGFKVVVVSNQAGVARGFFCEAFVKELHRALDRRIVAGGARVDGWYYCPHHPDATVLEYRQACNCRKPMPGMTRQAAAALDIDLARSFVIGDRWLDVELAQNAGARGILVRTGYGAAEERAPKPGVAPAFVADNLIEAVAWILALGSRAWPEADKPQSLEPRAQSRSPKI